MGVMFTVCRGCGTYVGSDITDHQCTELSDLERVTRERDEARAELARVTADHQAWRDAVEPVLKRANEQRESWSQIARAQARELTKAKARIESLDDENQRFADYISELIPKYDDLRAAAQRVINARENGEPWTGALWTALDQLTFALTDEPTEADHAE